MQQCQAGCTAAALRSPSAGEPLPLGGCLVGQWASSELTGHVMELPLKGEGTAAGSQTLGSGGGAGSRVCVASTPHTRLGIGVGLTLILKKEVLSTQKSSSHVLTGPLAQPSPEVEGVAGV